MILAFETSCDETGVALVDCSRSIYSDTSLSFKFKTHASALNSQAHLHAEYGGVYPTLAKREHVQNIIPLTASVLNSYINQPQSPAGSSYSEKKQTHYNLPHEKKVEKVKKWLSHETSIVEPLVKLSKDFDPYFINSIGVTTGPGLEPALWVGINTARSLALLWDKPLIPINHIEGHIVSSFMSQSEPITFPLLSFVVSGGHTEFIISNKIGEYDIIGSTRDDAVGEAFDKGARLLGLPYPGGALLSQKAHIHRNNHPDWISRYNFPRPMIHTDDLDFSFSGLKTSLLYKLKDMSLLDSVIPEELQLVIAREYEDAIIDTLIAKLTKAISLYNPKTISISGGVSANTYLRERAKNMCQNLLLPPLTLTGDNAEMIAMAGIYIEKQPLEELDSIQANSNWRLKR